MAECSHGEDPRWCAWCKNITGDPAKVLATGPTIEAHYDGVCVHCETRFEAGDSITYSGDADGWAISSHTEEPKASQPDLSGF